MGFGFPTNLLISGRSLSKIFLAETDETVLESVCSSKTISFSFFEIVQVVLLEVPSVLTFKSERIYIYIYIYVVNRDLFGGKEFCIFLGLLYQLYFLFFEFFCTNLLLIGRGIG